MKKIELKPSFSREFSFEDSIECTKNKFSTRHVENNALNGETLFHTFRLFFARGIVECVLVSIIRGTVRNWLNSSIIDEFSNRGFNETILFLFFLKFKYT